MLPRRFRRHVKPLAAIARLRRMLPYYRSDPNLFIPFVFNSRSAKPFMQAALHRDLQQFLTDHPKALIELPRDHGKTTQIVGRVLWELGRDPTLRVKIVCATDTVARERVRFLRDAIRHNHRVRLVFPRLRPGSPWQAESFGIDQATAVIGPSVAAFGVASGSTGTRADLLICDDIVDAKSIGSRAERNAVRSEFENNLMNLLEPTGRFWGLCTPWHDDDLNAHLKSNPSFSLFRRAIGPACEPIWPDVWSTMRLTERLAEIGEAAFARGYRLVAINEADQLIKPDWIHYFDTRPERPTLTRTLLAIDPAATTNDTSDFTAMVVLGQSDQAIMCLDAVAGRWTVHEIRDQVTLLHAMWTPDVILFESNGAFDHSFAMLERESSFGATMVKEKASRNKSDRVRAFGVYVRAGAIRFARQGQSELIHQMVSYPFAKHDDLVDACAMGTAFLKMGSEQTIRLL